MSSQADITLIEQARKGDRDAFGQLWLRHSAVGLRVARSLTSPDDAEDLLLEAYTRILTLVSRGKGPNGPFRPYLYQTLRNLAAQNRSERVEYTDSLDELSDPESELDADSHSFELSTVGRAFKTLSERQRAALWYRFVEGLPPRKVAPLLGTTAVNASAISRRALRALRTSWVAAHRGTSTGGADCRTTIDNLIEYHENRLRAEARRQVEAHLPRCVPCRQISPEAEKLAKRPMFVLLLLFGFPASGSLLEAVLGHDASVTTPPTSAAVSTRPPVHLLTATVASLSVASLVGVTLSLADLSVSADTSEGSRGSGGSEDDDMTGSGDAGVDDMGADGTSGDADGEPWDLADELPSFFGDQDAVILAQELPLHHRPGGSAPSDADTAYDSEAGSDPAEMPVPPLPTVELVTNPSEHSRVGLRGHGAQPSAVVEIHVHSEPAPDSQHYDRVFIVYADESGNWTLDRIAGVVPVNVSIFVRQIFDERASEWSEVIVGKTFGIQVPELFPQLGGPFNQEGWEFRGWPGAHWRIEHVDGLSTPLSGGFNGDGTAWVSVSTLTGELASGTHQFRIGYRANTYFHWQQYITYIVP